MKHIPILDPDFSPPSSGTETSPPRWRRLPAQSRWPSALEWGDSRLGFHQEAQAFFFDVSSIEVKLRNLERSIMK